VSLMLRKCLINLAEDVRERIVENWHKFPGDIMAWHGGGQSTKNECLVMIPSHYARIITVLVSF
jgi:hypothetical protein